MYIKRFEHILFMVKLNIKLIYNIMNFSDQNTFMNMFEYVYLSSHKNKLLLQYPAYVQNHPYFIQNLAIKEMYQKQKMKNKETTKDKNIDTQENLMKLVSDFGNILTDMEDDLRELKDFMKSVTKV